LAENAATEGRQKEVAGTWIAGRTPLSFFNKAPSFFTFNKTAEVAEVRGEEAPIQP